MTTRMREIHLTINGTSVREEVEVRTLLSDFVRHQMHLTGTHVGCEQGVCGSCTLLVDGEAVRSCLMLAVQANGRTLETVESLASDGELSGFQKQMRDSHGLQCGFCTPGILMSAAGAERSGATADEVATDVLGGHVCRCTGYTGIREAIQEHWKENVR